MKTIYQLLEGGNVFKHDDGTPATQRIDLKSVKPTVQWLEKVTGLPLVDNMLGTTGRKETSGDLDLAVDANKVNKDDLVNKLTSFLAKHGQDPAKYIRKSGINVHFKTPINGNAKNGFVQTDFMFVPDIQYSKFSLSAAPDSNFKGMHRAILINSIGKALGYKMNQHQGLMNRETNELITNDPNKIAKILLNPNARKEDLHSVETIMSALEGDPNKEAKIADARQTFEREGLVLEQGVSESYFLAKLRDKIVQSDNMSIVTEGVRIEHPEDLPFSYGGKGVQQAIDSLKGMMQTTDHVTIKWDGRPAIIFGRKPNGDFVLTDKSGFTSKGYDGLATSPREIAKVMNMRKGDRGEIIGIYQKMFPLLEKVIPQGFVGYIQGDLLYSDRPKKNKNGQYEFTPNTVTYEVDADSAIGKAIAQSEIAVAIHTYHRSPEGPSMALQHQANKLQHNPSVLMLDPYFDETPVVKLNKRTQNKINGLSKLAPTIDDFMRPTELRDRKITDLPQQIKKYVNARVREGHFDNLARGFITWFDSAAPSQRKAENVREYIGEHSKGFAALIKAFLTISEVKNEVIQQLDDQGGPVHAHIAGEPGHEGYVADTEHGPVKFVDRMRFSSANFAKNNPDLK